MNPHHWLQVIGFCCHFSLLILDRNDLSICCVRVGKPYVNWSRPFPKYFSISFIFPNSQELNFCLYLVLTEKRSGERLHFLRDSLGEQLHSSTECEVWRLVHGLHTQRQTSQGLQNQATPAGSPLHEEAAQGTPNRRAQTLWFHQLPFQQTD